MPKNIIILVIIIFLSAVDINYANAASHSKTVNFLKDYKSSPSAEKILYNFILKDLKVSAEKAEQEFNISPQSVYAIEVNLNGDNVNEIIGFVNTSFYQGTAGHSLFILRKENDSYISIDYLINFEPLANVYILKKRTNGYNDIKLYGSNYYNFKPFVIKFDGKTYSDKQQIEDLENALKSGEN